MYRMNYIDFNMYHKLDKEIDMPSMLLYHQIWTRLRDSQPSMSYCIDMYY